MRVLFFLNQRDLRRTDEELNHVESDYIRRNNYLKRKRGPNMKARDERARRLVLPAQTIRAVTTASYANPTLVESTRRGTALQN